MFSMGQSSNNYERLSEDGAETLPMYEMPPKSDFAPPSTLGTSAQLHASPTAVISNTDNFEFEKYVPYQLELKKCGLFPEFLYHFKKNFGAESAENRAYCHRSLAEFTASYVGHDNDILSSVARVEADFEQKFRKCLHPDLLREYLEWTFTRSCVESEFREKLNERDDLASGPIRLNALTSTLILTGKVEKLVEFFRAYGYSEQFFWVYLMQIFGGGALQSSARSDRFNAAARKWQGEQGSLESRAQGFVYDDAVQLGIPRGLKIFFLCLGLFAIVFSIFVLVMVMNDSK